MKLQHLKSYLNNAQSRAKRDRVPFSLTLRDLIEIAVDECPIFKTPFVWGSSGLGKGKTRPDSPTLDRILPELGYIKGNVAFLSYRANRIKDNGTMQEHYDIADWIWNHTHAKEKPATPVPAGDSPKGDFDTKYGALFTAGFGQDHHYSHYHRGAVHGEDPHYRTEESSGDGVAHRNKKVEPSPALTGSQNNGDADPEISRVEITGGRLFD